MRRLLQYYLGSILLVLCLVGTAQADRFTYDYQRIIDLDYRPALEMRLGPGTVTIQGSAENRIVINAVKTVRATDAREAEEVAAHIEIRVRQEDKAVRLETNYLRMVEYSPSFWEKVLGTGEDSYGQVDFVLQVPTGSDIHLEGVPSSIIISDLNGNLTVSSSAPTAVVKISNLIGGVTVKTRQADLDLSNVEGTVDIDNVVGNTTVEYLNGPITVSQPEGRINLKWVEGDIRLKSRSSVVNVVQVRGAIDLVTRTSEVNVQTELDSRNDYFLETESGQITFSIPESASADLQLETESGRITTDVPVAIESMSRNRLVGKCGRGGVTVNLTSRSGDLVVGLY